LTGLAIAPDTMIADLHGTKDYRAHIVKVMTQRAVKNIS
ncbi:carbon monoxide dehydrogenase, partial [Sedimentitalea sp. CAU 1593]|nr:carbon monoxide dehydrogenase [Arenibacterium arenosum]MBJ6373516.1 carbon monoxide dehydrogenase [Arenibacterium arenosum]